MTNLVRNKCNFSGSSSSRRSKPTKSSTSSQVSTDYLEQTIECLKNKTLDDSSKEMYYAVWCTFNKFFIKLDRKPDNWEDWLALFLAYLLDNRTRKATIKSYTSALKSILRDDGINIDKNSVKLVTLLKASNYIETEERTWLSIHLGMKRVLLDKICAYFGLKENQPYLNGLYKAMIVSAYYGLFHTGELTVSNHSNHAISFRDVHKGRNKGKILFLLHSSKTYKRSEPLQIVTITEMNSKNSKWATDMSHYCPFKLISEYMSLRPRPLTMHVNEPFFCFQWQFSSQSWKFQMLSKEND